MNTNGLAKRYETLSAEERFRLIVAAGARGDEAEQDRLRLASRRITLTMRDYSPWAEAFEEVAWVSFAELLEEAAKYDDARQRWADVGEDIPGYFGELEDEAERMPRPKNKRRMRKNELTHADRMFDLFLAQGFMVKVRGDGWKLFCAKLGIPPFAFWEWMPGLDRVKHALELVEKNDSRPGPAFVPEGMLRFLNRIRPEGKPEATLENLISVEGIAEDLQTVLRARAKWHGAD